MPWSGTPELLGGCFVCFERGGRGRGAAGDRGWAAAVTLGAHVTLSGTAVAGAAGGPYAPGLLALREGPMLERAVDRLSVRPQLLLVNATGRDHPRRAGLALHLGAQLGIPTVGVTHRPLLAQGEAPADRAGAEAPLRLDGVEVGRWVRTRVGARPVAAHAAWGTDPATAASIVARSAVGCRTPEPIRRARMLARAARAAG